MKILLIDDHPIIIEAYVSILKAGVFSGYDNTYDQANTCEAAYKTIIQNYKIGNAFDFIFLDDNLPSFKEMNIDSGVDLIGHIRKLMPDCKIIMFTAHTEILVIYTIFKKHNPDGLAIKSDLTPAKLKIIVDSVLAGNQFLSETVKACVSAIWKKDVMVEEYNRQILYHISKGVKIKDIENYVDLSTSAIQKRTILMKKAFNVTDDTSLVSQAILLGFI